MEGEREKEKEREGRRKYSRRHEREQREQHTHLLCHIPESHVSHVLLRAGGEVELEGESKHAIDSLQKV